MAEQNLAETKQSWAESSLWSLLAANAITIVLAVVYEWSIWTVMMIYWWQSIIIGFFHFLRLLKLKNPYIGPGSKAYKYQQGKGFVPVSDAKKNSLVTGMKVFTAVFFLMHYGGFHLGYLFFLTIFSYIKGGGIFSGDTVAIALAVAIFFINHLFSFRKNLERDAKKTQSIGKMMFLPYARIIPMHLTIIFAFFFLDSIAGLVFFLVLKTIADVIMHRIEHR
ncbi:MAG: DUF6498-containing protein [archaeon]